MDNALVICEFLRLERRDLAYLYENRTHYAVGALYDFFFGLLGLGLAYFWFLLRDLIDLNLFVVGSFLLVRGVRLTFSVFLTYERALIILIWYNTPRLNQLLGNLTHLCSLDTHLGIHLLGSTQRLSINEVGLHHDLLFS